MMRTLIGNKFGQMGFYVSQPGDDLANPQKSLLLDTRFSSLEVYLSGRDTLQRSGPFSGTYQFYRTLNYPTLGYRPQFYIALIDANSDTVNYPPNLRQVGFRLAQDCSVDVTASQINVSMSIGGQNATNGVGFVWVLFRNPA